MGGAALSLVMDVLVLFCMGWTIYFSLKLSKSLGNFRQSRKEFEGLIHELSRNIDAAQRAVEKLKLTSHQAREDLQPRLEDAGAMIDELQIMIQSGENLARRLEGPAEGRRRESSFYVEEDPYEKGFAIQDYELQKEGPRWEPEEKTEPNSYDDDDVNVFTSQAERELFQALQSNKKAGKR